MQGSRKNARWESGEAANAKGRLGKNRWESMAQKRRRPREYAPAWTPFRFFWKGWPVEAAASIRLCSALRPHAEGKGEGCCPQGRPCGQRVKTSNACKPSAYSESRFPPARPQAAQTQTAGKPPPHRGRNAPSSPDSLRRMPSRAAAPFPRRAGATPGAQRTG